MAFGRRVVQRDVSFTVRRTMIGLLRPTVGNVFYDGTPFWSGDEDRRYETQRRFGVLFQSGALWSSLTLAENVALPLAQYTRLSQHEISAIVSLKLSLVGLSGFEDFYPSAISGG